MNMFNLPIPTRIAVTDNTKNYTKKPWPIKTFLTEENKNVNEVIDYYYQKIETFMNLANTQLSKQLQMYHGVNSLEELFIQAADTYDKKVSDIWLEIQKIPTGQLQPNIQKLNNYTNQLIRSGKGTISFAQILSLLSDSSVKSGNNINTSNIPGTINIYSFQQNLNSFAQAKGLDPQALGAHRAVTMGQIYEIGVNEIIASNTHQVLNYFATGNQRTKQTINQNLLGKTDGLFTISGINIDLSEINSNLQGKLNSNAQARNIITLEADEIIDLNQNGYNYAIQTYVNNPTAAALLGIQNKAWIGKSGTMSSFAPSANEIRQRTTWTPTGEPISKWFANDGRFGNYTGYVLSKYLISAIGAHNALMATGAHGITPTYLWLWNLYMSGKHLRHTFNLMESMSENGELIGKNNRSYHEGAKYTVRNNIVIANYKPA